MGLGPDCQEGLWQLAQPMATNMAVASRLYRSNRARGAGARNVTKSASVWMELLSASLGFVRAGFAASRAQRLGAILVGKQWGRHAELIRIGITREGEERRMLGALKAFVLGAEQTAAAYARNYGGTVKEIRKAQRVNAAFQQVLDHPQAAEALQHPALQPLLDEAAD